MIPPLPAIYESDADFRMRIPQAFEGMSVAGRSALMFSCTQRLRAGSGCFGHQSGACLCDRQRTVTRG